MNSLNLTLQGDRQRLHTTRQSCSFQTQSGTVERLTEKGDTSMFPNLTMLLQSKSNMKCDFTKATTGAMVQWLERPHCSR